MCSCVFTESKSLWSKEGATTFGTLMIKEGPRARYCEMKDPIGLSLQRSASRASFAAFLSHHVIILQKHCLYLGSNVCQKPLQTKKIPKGTSRLSKPLRFSALLLLLLLQPLLQLQRRNLENLETCVCREKNHCSPAPFSLPPL